MDRYLNPDYITSVEVYKKSIASRFAYKKAHKICFFWNRPEGVYKGNQFIPQETFDTECKKYCVIDEEVYFKPHVEIYYGSSYRYSTKWFETVEELTQYISKLQLDVRLIKVK